MASFRDQINIKSETMKAASGDGALGRYLFGQQAKFAILQTLILIELSLTSSSKLIYSLCIGGGILLWFFTVLLKDDNMKDNLSLIYPLQVGLSSALLSLITLIKVYFAHEQTDLSLVFLGIAFTSDHVMLVYDVIPMMVKYVFASDSHLKVIVSNDDSDIEADPPEDICQCTVVRRCLHDLGNNPCLGKTQDAIAMGMTLFMAGLGCCLGALHLPLTYPIGKCIYWFLNERLIQKWTKEECIKRARRLSSTVDVTEPNMRHTVEKVLHRAIQLYTIVLILDLEFVVISIVMAVLSEGVLLGGQRIPSYE